MLQNTQETEDLRVRRTRKLLQEALIELTVEKGFGAVTVRDITERAMVNRSTFYRHYLDKYDLLDQYMNDVHELFTHEALVTEKLPDVPEETPKGLLRLLQHIQTRADFYRVMLGAKGDPAFVQRFRQNIERRFRYLLDFYGEEITPKASPVDMRLNYVSCADIGAILWWLENDQPCSAEQLAKWLGQLSSMSVGLALLKK